jgi:hypothetical protein
MSAMRPAAPACDSRSKFWNTEVLPPVSWKPHFGSESA